MPAQRRAVLLDNLMADGLSRHRLASSDVAHDVSLHDNVVSIDEDAVDIAFRDLRAASALQQTVSLDDGVGEVCGAAVGDLASLAKLHPATPEVAQFVVQHLDAAWHGNIQVDGIVASLEKAVLNPGPLNGRAIGRNALLLAEESAIVYFQCRDGILDGVSVAVLHPVAVDAIIAPKLHVAQNQRWRIVRRRLVEVDGRRTVWVHPPSLAFRAAAEHAWQAAPLQHKGAARMVDKRRHRSGQFRTVLENQRHAIIDFQWGL